MIPRSELGAARQRVERLLAVTRELVGRAAPGRSALCERLVTTTGLSLQGVEWALEHCLEPELGASAAEIDALIASVPRAARAHVILPAQVFIAAHRALLLGVASAPRVFVRPSRREPLLARALAARAGDLFEVVERLPVEPGDHVWAYGADTTLEALRRELPAGTVLHAHGSGFGVAVVDLEQPGTASGLDAVAREVARDTLVFDQRGCLSPRLVLALGPPERVLGLGEALANALDEAAARVPRGQLSPEERADAAWYRQCAACFGRVWDTGQGMVSLRAPEPALPAAPAGEWPVNLPPVGRHLEVLHIARLEPALQGLAPWLTSVGCSEPALERRIRPLLPRARVCSIGQMQRPPLDGPVDWRRR